LPKFLGLNEEKLDLIFWWHKAFLAWLFRLGTGTEPKCVHYWCLLARWCDT